MNVTGKKELTMDCPVCGRVLIHISTTRGRPWLVSEMSCTKCGPIRMSEAHRDGTQTVYHWIPACVVCGLEHAVKLPVEPVAFFCVKCHARIDIVDNALNRHFKGVRMPSQKEKKE
jgi:hypothetical protein